MPCFAWEFHKTKRSVPFWYQQLKSVQPWKVQFTILIQDGTKSCPSMVENLVLHHRNEVQLWFKNVWRLALAEETTHGAAVLKGKERNRVFSRPIGGHWLHVDWRTLCWLHQYWSWLPGCFSFVKTMLVCALSLLSDRNYDKKLCWRDTKLDSNQTWVKDIL